MTRHRQASAAFALLLAVSLAACGNATEPTPGASASSVPRSAATSEAAAPASAAPSGTGQACAPLPKLEFSKDRFVEGRAAYAAGKPARTKFEANFREAYEAACAQGWLARKPLMDPRAAHPDTLFVINVPDANVDLIYFDDAEERPAANREMILEGPYANAANEIFVPTVDELTEAIYCHAVGATPKEQEETGRCLVD